MFVLLLSPHYMFYFYRADFQLKLSELTQVFRDAKKAYVSTSTRISFIQRIQTLYSPYAGTPVSKINVNP